MIPSRKLRAVVKPFLSMHNTCINFRPIHPGGICFIPEFENVQLSSLSPVGGGGGQ
jgi:hypothetical protein